MKRLELQQGFTLLEVLVALLILSVGLIGLAGLHLIGVKNVRDANYRSQAVLLAYDIGDRMRANINGVTNGDYNNATGSRTASCTTSSGCTSAQLAADDVALWKQAVSDSLPAGDAIVCLDLSPDDDTCNNGTGAVYAVKIWWDDDRNPATNKVRLSVPFVP